MQRVTTIGEVSGSVTKFCLCFLRIHRVGLKASRGMGWITNPKKAAYNRVYWRTTKGCLTLVLAFSGLLMTAILGSRRRDEGLTVYPLITHYRPSTLPRPDSTGVDHIVELDGLNYNSKRIPRMGWWPTVLLKSKDAADDA